MCVFFFLCSCAHGLCSSYSASRRLSGAVNSCLIPLLVSFSSLLFLQLSPSVPSSGQSYKHGSTGSASSHAQRHRAATSMHMYLTRLQQQQQRIRRLTRALFRSNHPSYKLIRYTRTLSRSYHSQPHFQSNGGWGFAYKYLSLILSGPPFYFLFYLTSGIARHVLQV